jgi:hypothetical protein
MAGGKADNDGTSGAMEGTTMVQRVVHEVGGGMMFLVLTKNNYLDWAMLMRVKLKAWDLWVTINKGVVDLQEDMMALGCIGVGGATRDGGDHGGQELNEGGMEWHFHDACQRRSHQESGDTIVVKSIRLCDVPGGWIGGRFCSSNEW